MKEATRGSQSRPSWAPLAICVAVLLVVIGIAGMSGTDRAYASNPLVAGGKALVTNTGGDTIRVRQDAGTLFPQIAEAHEGQVVPIVAGPRSDSSGRAWYKIVAPGGTGWVSAEFLQAAGSSSVPAAPAATLAPSLPAAHPATPKLTGSASVGNSQGDPVRLREQPSTTGKVLMLLDPGAPVSIQAGPLTDSSGIAWYSVQYNGVSGWAMAQYLVGAASAGKQNVAPAQPTAPSRPVATPTSRLAAEPAPPAAVKPAEKPAAPATPQQAPPPAAVKPETTATEKPAEKPLATPTQKPLPSPTQQPAPPQKPTAVPTPLPTQTELPREKPLPAPTQKAAAEPRPTSTDKAADKPKLTPTAVPTAVPTLAPTATHPAPTVQPEGPVVTAPQSTGGATSTAAQYRQWVDEAKALYPYPQTADKMWRVMQCESGGNPRASGGGGSYLGLFQYAPSTWRGSWNPYRDNSIFDAKSQVFATAKAWSIGMQSAWSCYYITEGR